MAKKVEPLKNNSHSNLLNLDVGEDVLRERNRAYSVEPGEDNPIVLQDLRKEFPAQDGNPKKVAVANMSLAVARGECFGGGSGPSAAEEYLVAHAEP